MKTEQDQSCFGDNWLITFLTLARGNQCIGSSYSVQSLNSGNSPEPACTVLSVAAKIVFSAQPVTRSEAMRQTEVTTP